MIGLVPFWGLSLIATSVIFLAPLIYKTNKEAIDAQLNKAANIANQQSEQVRKLASQHAARATETTKQYVGDYSAKAQDLIGNARRSVSPSATTKQAKTEPLSTKSENVPSVPSTSSYKPDSYKEDSFKQDSFPVIPKQEFSHTPIAEFPAAPKNDFTAPPVGQSVNELRKSEDEPILAA